MQDLRGANKEQRRQRILAAAHDLIGRSGTEALTMRVLADEAGVSVPTVYALVGGRDDVITALMAGGVHRFDDGVVVLGSRGLDRAAGLVDLFTGIVDHERELVRCFLASGVLSTMGSDQFPLLHRVQGELEGAFAEAVEDGQLDGATDPAMAATATVRLGLGAIIDWVVRHGDEASLRTDLVGALAVVVAAYS